MARSRTAIQLRDHCNNYWHIVTAVTILWVISSAPVAAFPPVRPGDEGVGIETQFLVTWHRPSMLVHFNAGGFHDPRAEVTEHDYLLLPGNHPEAVVQGSENADIDSAR